MNWHGNSGILRCSSRRWTYGEPGDDPQLIMLAAATPDAMRNSTKTLQVRGPTDRAIAAAPAISDGDRRSALILILKSLPRRCR